MAESRERALAEVLAAICEPGRLPVGDPHPCPYLPGRDARNRAFVADEFDGDLYQALMDRGFRRSGRLFYQPACSGCRECMAVRVPVAAFKPSRSQRRVWRRNADLTVTVGIPELTEEKHALYSRYLAYQHAGPMTDDWEDLRRFLYESPVDTLEFCYRVEGRLVGVGIADLSSKSLSSVYFMFDPPEAKRSPGVYSVLWEIGWCAGQSIPYYYLGFYVRDCKQMNYKIRFRPCETLGQDGRWARLEETSDA